MNTGVKICGITKVSETLMLNKYKPDFAGFVMFYEKSRRNNTVQNTWQLLRHLNSQIKRVAVVVSPTAEQINIIQQMDFQIIQIHGVLSEEAAVQIKKPVWRAFNINSGINSILSEEVKGVAGYVLDGAVPGQGKPFDWTSLTEFKRRDKQLILAGGLNEYNVEEAMSVLNPDIVDISSGVEGENGKDAAKVKKFIASVRKHG